jgi:hypothetical protein
MNQSSTVIHDDRGEMMHDGNSLPADLNRSYSVCEHVLSLPVAKHCDDPYSSLSIRKRTPPSVDEEHIISLSASWYIVPSGLACRKEGERKALLSLHIDETKCESDSIVLLLSENVADVRHWAAKVLDP